MNTSDVPTDMAAKHGLQSAELSVPAMPNIRGYERYEAYPFPLVDGLPLTVGWMFVSDRKGGPAFVTISRSKLGSLKVVQRFPLTRDGWERAWNALVKANPDGAQKVRARLRERQAEQRDEGGSEIAALHSRSLASLEQVALLGGYAPDAAIAIGERYDARFLEDRLALYPCRHWEPLAEVPYSEVEDVEIGGPGLVRRGGGFFGGGFGAVGALEGMAIAAVLNAMTTRASMTTVVRVQAKSCELFLLWTKSTPEQLRIELSRALGAIRASKPAHDTRTAGSPVEALAKLSDMLQAGLITREEFDQFKAKLLQA